MAKAVTAKRKTALPVIKIKAGEKAVIKKGPPSLTLPPTTTEQEDIVSAGQRTINLIWETTQSKIALRVIAADLIICIALPVAVLVLRIDITVNQLAVITLCVQPLSLITGIVIGFYFSRTNHSAIGGVGKKIAPSDKGTR